MLKVRILVTKGAYLEARDTSERTALYLAAGRGHEEVVKFLASVGANVNGEEIHGNINLNYIFILCHCIINLW